MRSGDLNKYITIQHPTRTSDGMGGFSEVYVTADTIWAAIWPISANELVRSMKETMEISHRIRIRYRRVFRPEWRIKFGNRYFNIVSIINPNTKNELLDLMCREAI